MKRVALAFLAVLLAIHSVGCQGPRAARRGCNCQQCGHYAGDERMADGLMSGRYARGGRPQDMMPQDQGPPTAAVAYPYYTLRGPRDFLAPNPPSIGR